MEILLISIISYNKDTPFPSSYTLLPVLGTFAVILFSGKSTLVAKILSFKATFGEGLCEICPLY